MVVVVPLTVRSPVTVRAPPTVPLPLTLRVEIVPVISPNDVAPETFSVPAVRIPAVSYTHLRAHRDRQKSRMPSSA